MDGEAVIEIAGLRKTFRGVRRGRQVVVDGLDMTVPTGGVHGFLGPNGSGKTTTIRTLLRQVGAIVEPQFFPAFSARRNLRLLAGWPGCPGTGWRRCWTWSGCASAAGTGTRPTRWA
jgi:ABC-2 type transport system ATP-binding protein